MLTESAYRLGLAVAYRSMSMRPTVIGGRPAAAIEAVRGVVHGGGPRVACAYCLANCSTSLHSPKRSCCPGSGAGGLCALTRARLQRCPQPVRLGTERVAAFQLDQ